MAQLTIKIPDELKTALGVVCGKVTNETLDEFGERAIFNAVCQSGVWPKIPEEGDTLTLKSGQTVNVIDTVKIGGRLFARVNISGIIHSLEPKDIRCSS